MDADEISMVQGLGEAWEGQMVVLQAVCRGSDQKILQLRGRTVNRTAPGLHSTTRRLEGLKMEGMALGSVL
ncbi:hypothetical protein BU25DRAFT_409190, partial [Macroventuria anomochaeta]